MPDPARAALRALAAGAAMVACAACATLHPEVREARRAEEEVERVELPRPTPAVPRPAVKPLPPAAAAAPLAPPATARPFAQLAGNAGSVPGTVIYAVDDVCFAPASAQLDAAARARLDQLAAAMRALAGGYRVEVQGHTDAAGSEGDNLAISLRRAETVRDHLRRALDLASPRIAVVALGSRHPAADNSTAAGRARNRRAVVLVLR